MLAHGISQDAMELKSEEFSRLYRSQVRRQNETIFMTKVEGEYHNITRSHVIYIHGVPISTRQFLYLCVFGFSTVLMTHHIPF